MAIPHDVAKNRQAILDSSSYLMAEVDIEFLGRGEQRPVRMQLELQKVETLLREKKIHARKRWPGQKEEVEESADLPWRSPARSKIQGSQEGVVAGRRAPPAATAHCHRTHTVSHCEKRQTILPAESLPVMHRPRTPRGDPAAEVFRSLANRV